MTRKPRSKPDPIERTIERALDPGGFIAERACYSFVSGLDKVAASIDDLKQADPVRAITLYETFLAGCYEKAEELDDSSGSFGQFVAALYCGWIKARQAAGADPDDTAAGLLARMDDDPYGFCYGLEQDAAKAFDKVGLAAFAKQIRARFDAAATTFRSNPDHERRRWGKILRTLYLAQRNVPAYLALAQETGLTAQDCHALATMLVATTRPRTER
jgi:hypothetical protein